MPIFYYALGPVLLACLAPVPLFAQQPATNSHAVQTPAHAKPVIDADGTYHFGNGVIAPKLVYTVDAEFSDAAQRRKIDGTAVIALKVGTDGLPADVRVKHSMADGLKPKDRKAALSLDQKAVEAVRQYRFEPGMYEGKPVPVAITVEVNFHIYPQK
jgi:TonB family protein